MLDDLKDNIKTQLANIWDSLQEQDWFLTLREKFEVLPQATQKGVIIGLILLVIFGLAMIPYGNYSSSQDFMATFEEERDLTRQFLKAQSDGALPTLPAPQNEARLRTKVQEILGRRGLKEDQISEFQGSSTIPRFAPKSSVVAGLEIPLKTLNVKQVKDIGFELQKIKNLKLTGMEINTSPKDDHYYDVTYTVKNIALPPLAIKEEEESKGKNKRKKRSRKKSTKSNN